MAGDGDRKSSGIDDTVPASTPPPEPRSSLPSIAPPADTRYRLGQELGRGGMGRVVEAYDTHLGRTVALKEVLPQAGDIDRRFQREVRITARLEHASIVPLYDSGRLADGRPFYVMRRVSGKPLSDVLARARTLESRLALLPNVLAAIDAVAHAHRRGVIHRDLKPQNILVGELGETVVIDWGLAKVLGENDEPVHDSLEPRLPTAADSLQTQVGAVFGTPGFMPPEQARGDELGPAGDVYALGATLYQMLVGRPPFHGSSATDVITSTLRDRLEPIARACPGAPPELAAIIDKALAYEPRDRYRDAGELAEDVRAFLTGQLVAAHRYTRRQRLARFVRRNRAPLVVAALATVGLAIVAWISVARVLHERDAAERATAEARLQRAEAERRTVEVRERADQLLLLHARSLLDVDATQAIAVLKQLPATSALLDEAKAVARAAVTRGVAYGIPTTGDMTLSLEMTSDGRRVLQVAADGHLQIVDVVTRKPIFTATVPATSTGRWVDHERAILLHVPHAGLVILDPRTGTSVPLSVAGTVAELDVTPQGDAIALIDAQRQVVVIDVATRQARIVPGAKATQRIAIAPNGSWVAFGQQTAEKRNQLVVADVATGRVLVRHDGDVNLLVPSPDNGLAAALIEGVVEIPDVAHPTIVRIPVDQRSELYVHSMLYVEHRLVMLTQRALLAWNGKDLARLHDFNSGAMLAARVDNDAVVITTADGIVYALRGGMVAPLHLTSRPTGIVRVASAASSSTFVATAGDALLAWDLKAVLPDWAPVIGNAVFATENLLVEAAALAPDWSWWDIARNTRLERPLAVPMGPMRALRVDGEDGRTLLVIARQSPEPNTAVIAYPDGRQRATDVAGGLAVLVPGDAFVYSPGKGRVLVRVGDEEPRELATLDGDVAALAGDRHGFAALSVRGDLVRGANDGSRFERTQLATVDRDVVLGIEPDGNILVASGRVVQRWSTRLEEIVRLPDVVQWMRVASTGTVFAVANNALLFMSATGDRSVRPLPMRDGPNVVATDTRVFSVSSTGDVSIVELPSRIEWSLPKPYGAPPRFAASLSGRRLYQVYGSAGVLWNLPDPGADFDAWLDELTNATEAERHVRWPW